MYEAPKMEVLFFYATDIVRTSNFDNQWSDENVDGDDGWT